MEFNIGDIVEIITDEDGHCPYSFTTPGSIGKVVDTQYDLEYNEVRVSWTFYASGYRAGSKEWTVEKQYLKLIEATQPENPANNKYSKIISKMRYLDKKFKERKLTHEF